MASASIPFEFSVSDIRTGLARTGIGLAVVFRALSGRPVFGWSPGPEALSEGVFPFLSGHLLTKLKDIGPVVSEYFCASLP